MLTAPWCGWTMLVLLLCAVMAEWFQPGVITQSPSGLLARTDRTYKEAPTNFMAQVLITLFRLGTPSVALCLCFCSADKAPFAAFWIVFGLLLGVLMVKMVCGVLINYTFSLSRRFGNAYEAYGDIATLGATALYPVVLVLLRISNQVVSQWIVGVMAVLFICAWSYRTLRTYLVSPAALFYLVIYIATLEVLPMAAFVYLSAKLITIL